MNKKSRIFIFQSEKSPWMVNFSISGFGSDIYEIYQGLIPLLELFKSLHNDSNESWEIKLSDNKPKQETNDLEQFH